MAQEQTLKRTLKQYMTMRHDQLDKLASPYLNDWRDVADFVPGRQNKWLSSNTGASANNQTRNDLLLIEEALLSNQILAAGMVSGVTNPSRPWFKLELDDQDLMDYAPVKNWLSDVERIMLRIFAKSNFYRACYAVYLQMGAFGNGCCMAWEDFETVMRFETHSTGAYRVGLNGKRETDTLSRKYSMSVENLVSRFGLENVSKTVRNLYDRGSYTSEVEVIHIVEPNKGRRFDSPWAEDMPWRSVYMETGGDNSDDKPLERSGFNEKPFMVPRWSAEDDEPYSSSCPGLDSLGTNRSLQMEELDKQTAIEKAHNPPMVGDASLKANGANLKAGEVTWVPNMAASGKPGIMPVYNVNPDISGLAMDMQEKIQRIQRFFYVDLFLMISNMDRAQVTATEVIERKQEKMLMLGPVLDSINREFLDPVIDRTFARGLRAGIFPDMPRELQQAGNINVEYISILAQAQKAVSTAGLEQSIAFVANMSQIWPEARHKINAQQAVDEYAQAKGTQPRAIRGDDEAEEMAAAEQQAMQQQQMGEQVQGAAQAAKTLSDTRMQDQSALDVLTGALQ